MRRFLSDRRGVAAVEMALVAPVIAGVALISFEAWRTATRAQDMREALKVGAQYYMNGGTDDVAARTLALQSWPSVPTGAAVSVARACVCGGAAHVCTTLCTTGDAPQVQVTLTASAAYPQAMFSPNLSTQRVVRVR